MTPEGIVKAMIKDRLGEEGAYFFMPVQTGYGAKTLDFLVCWRGFFLSIEAKAPGKAPTKYQQITMQRILDAGGIAVCIDCKEALDALFERLLG